MSQNHSMCTRRNNIGNVSNLQYKSTCIDKNRKGRNKIKVLTQIIRLKLLELHWNINA